MSVSSWQNQLNRFVDKYGVDGTITTPDGLTTQSIKIHIGKYSEQLILADVEQLRRKAVVTIRDFEVYGVPESGDKIEYLGQRATIDLVDPRIEAGGIIGYDFMLRGDAV